MIHAARDKSPLKILFGCFIYLLLLHLNLQSVIDFYFPGSSWTRAWIAVPFILVFLHLPRLVINSANSVPALLVSLFSCVLFVHMLLQGYRYGVSGAVVSWAAYGLWLGLFAWLLVENFDFVKKIIGSFFVVSSLLHAVMLLLDVFYFNGLFKVVTFGEVVRYYGIAVSSAVMALQLAVGAIFMLFQFFESKRSFLKLINATGFSLVFFALIISTVRGPLIYLCLSLLITSATLVFYGVNRNKFVFSFLTGLFLFFLMVSYSIKNAQATEFISQAFHLASDGNQGRMRQYGESLNMLGENVWVLFVGSGAGQHSYIPMYFDVKEFTSESSFLKALLEIGILGVTPLLVLLFVVVFGAFVNLKNAIVRENIKYFTVLLLILFQCLTHETLKTWLGALYLNVALALCVRVLIESGYLNRLKNVRMQYL